ncbi:membrane protein [Mycolicibacterium madagascariense]|uniref:Membrane protein n=1 Tax=Mycolicibacterium madagascariense TaxID=212765 RepID=A0A7I7XAA0_9MYCO|nr:hypothetical protein [Mycolicibacterium madagascariense]MCV7011913.1 hypothetical protein [Mycolicibacterium madagascariense]BBZ26235.1 membrane protein [Mycolicibacterium madagascariense]
MPAYALALTLLVTGPLLRPGYLLLRDAVSTPRSYLTDAALGLTEAAPRALPQDFAVAVASHVVDGGVVVKLLLIAGLWAAAWGAARLVDVVVPAAGVPGQFVAATVAGWNPYVAERLLQGHWSLLVGYGALPWVAVAVLRLRDGRGHPWALLFWIAAAGLTPTGLMLAAVVAVVTCAGPGSGWSRWRCAAWSLGAAVLGALPWLVAPLLAGSLRMSEVAGVPQFAARAEPGLGTLLSLAGLGGIWNGQAVPASRTTAFAVVATVVLLGIVALGLPAALRWPAARPLLVLAAVAVIAPALMATGPGLAAVEALTRAVPGLGVLRDGQKWVALALPGYAVAGASIVVVLRRRVPGIATAAVCSLALLAVLPDLAWGVGCRVTSVSYPAGWTAAAALIDADPRPVAVLPGASMRHFSWAGPAPVLDPLPRWVAADVLTTGDLVIGGQVVPGEGRRARDVERLVGSGAGVDELAAAGVGWVVVEGRDAPRLGLPVALAEDDLVVYRVGGDHRGAPHRGVMIAAHLAWLAALVAGAAGTIATAVTRRRRGAV